MFASEDVEQVDECSIVAVGVKGICIMQQWGIQ